MMVCPRFSELAFGDYWSGPGGTSGRKSPVFLRDRIATIVRSIFGSAGLESFVHIHIVEIERDLCGCQPLAMCHLLQGWEVASVQLTAKASEKRPVERHCG